MNIKNINIKLSQKSIATITFALFFGWVMAFPYEGPVLYAFANQNEISGTILNSLTIFFHFIGLIISGFITDSIIKAKNNMRNVLLICIVSTIIYPFIPSFYQYVILPASSFFAGIFVGSFGFFYEGHVDKKDRLKFAADLLIYSNIFLIVISVLTIHISPYIGWMSVLILLLLSLFFNKKLDCIESYKINNTIDIEANKKNNVLKRAILVLFIFVFVITINSGLMFQVIYPAYSNYDNISSLYTNIPYIVILYILKKLPFKMDKSFFLYIGIALLGFAYVIFMTLEINILSYFLVITTMLSCCGIFDLFWWSTFGEIFNYVNNPSKIFGGGLSMNVLGVWVGGLLGNLILKFTNNAIFMSSIVALVILLIVVMIIPILNKTLINLLREHTFLLVFYKEIDKNENDMNLDASLLVELTDREKEVVFYLIKGFTYKKIAQKLYISENTLKTHVKNIYRKAGVKSKVELIKIIMDLDSREYKNA